MCRHTTYADLEPHPYFSTEVSCTPAPAPFAGQDHRHRCRGRVVCARLRQGTFVSGALDRRRAKRTRPQQCRSSGCATGAEYHVARHMSQVPEIPSARRRLPVRATLRPRRHSRWCPSCESHLLQSRHREHREGQEVSLQRRRAWPRPQPASLQQFRGRRRLPAGIGRRGTENLPVRGRTASSAWSDLRQPWARHQPFPTRANTAFLDQVTSQSSAPSRPRRTQSCRGRRCA